MIMMGMEFIMKEKTNLFQKSLKQNLLFTPMWSIGERKVKMGKNLAEMVLIIFLGVSLAGCGRIYNYFAKREIARRLNVYARNALRKPHPSQAVP